MHITLCVANHRGCLLIRLQGRGTQLTRLTLMCEEGGGVYVGEQFEAGRRGGVFKGRRSGTVAGSTDWSRLSRFLLLPSYLAVCQCTIKSPGLLHYCYVTQIASSHQYGVPIHI